jgi:hypothetical protein
LGKAFYPTDTTAEQELIIPTNFLPITPLAMTIMILPAHAMRRMIITISPKPMHVSALISFCTSKRSHKTDRNNSRYTRFIKRSFHKNPSKI